jgi:hypothetical protein
MPLSNDLLHALLTEWQSELASVRATKGDYLRVATAFLCYTLDAQGDDVKQLASDLYDFCERRHNRKGQREKFREN